MKNPLHYQLSEYDCGPTSMLNAISFLFERNEIPPDLIRNIMLYCLDSYGPSTVMGKMGTSRIAMMFLSNWLEGYGESGLLPISSRYLSGNQVNMSSEGGIIDALRRGGVAVVRLYLDEEHYVLMTGICEAGIQLFDPYLLEGNPFPSDIQCVTTNPCRLNRIVPLSYFEKEVIDFYSLGEMEKREAVLLFNKNTLLTEEKTIEYFI